MKTKLTLLLALLIAFNLGFSQVQKMLYEGAPVFHGAKITGNYPGTDFLFTVPATGLRPITFTATNLPAGLTIEENTGIIRGLINTTNTYLVKITATNALGKAEQELKIEIGNRLSLTPTMGWNSWNVFTKYIDEKMVIEMADAMVSTGMRDVGYQYINLDDYWHAESRSADGKPVADAKKFPRGIKYVSDYLHAKGLKLGIYSDAGTKTCGKCFGGFEHEEIDAKVYAEWGVDLLKYDFCFVPLKKGEALARYTKMGTALKSSGRSIVYSICNWGLFAPWKWTEQVGGHYSRSTPDIFDIWKGGNLWTMSVMKIINRTKHWENYTQNHWNDLDMLLVGNYGKGHATSREGKYPGLNDTEYQSHMIIWSILNSPLLSSCDLRSMNEPTKNILLNAELLDINQDELGEAGKQISNKKGIRVFKKSLKDGRKVYAILNTGNKEIAYTFINSDLLAVRDVFNNKNLGAEKEIKCSLKKHETVLLVVGK